MTQDSNWKDNLHNQEISGLTDLQGEDWVDEMFHPYLNSSATPAPESLRGLSSSEGPDTVRKPKFQVVVRTVLRPLMEARCEALIAPDVEPRMTSEPPPATAMPEVPTLVRPRAATAPEPVSLPHEVREELLELRAEVMQAVQTQQLQTLMLCGVEAGAGTSFVAAQLTQLLAEYAPLRVAFMTLLPGREKKSHRRSQTTELPRVQFLLRRTERPNLAEIASANGTLTLTELLCHCQTTEVLRQMKTEFDLIVIDAPAVASYSEAAVLAALMDGVILVARPNVTPLRRMDRAHRRLHKAHAKVLGLVFNRQRG